MGNDEVFSVNSGITLKVRKAFKSGIVVPDYSKVYEKLDFKDLFTVN